MKSSIYALIAFVAANLFSGCATSSRTQSSAAANPLRVGIASEAPPLILGEKGDWDGIEIELATMLGAELGREVEFVQLSAGALPTSLEKGNIDMIMAGASTIKSEEKNIQLCNPYLTSGMMALVPSDDMYLYGQGFSQPFAGKVGVQTGSRGEAFMRTYFPKEKLTKYKSAEAAAKALIQGDVRMVLHDSLTIWWLNGLHQGDGVDVVPTPLSQRYLAWWVGGDDAALKESVNRFVATVQSDGRLRSVIKMWLPDAR